MALCIAPFLFNPHQFSLGDFIIDYREYLRWMSRGNSRAHANSWIGYCRLSRTRITGFKKKKMGHPSEKLSSDNPPASLRVIIFSEILSPLCLAIILTVAYLFVKVSFLYGPYKSSQLTPVTTVLRRHQRAPAHRRHRARPDRLQRGRAHRVVHHLALCGPDARRLLWQLWLRHGRHRPPR